MKFSELIGKKVVSLYDKCVSGVTIGAIFNQNFSKVKYLVVEDNREDAMFDELYLDVKNLYSASGDVIVIKNNFALVSVKQIDDASPIGLEVFTTLGASYGKVTDLILDEKFSVVNFVTSEKEIKFDCVAGVSAGVMIVQDEKQDKKIDLSKFKHKTQHIVSDVAKDKILQAVILPIYNAEDEKEDNVERVKKVQLVEQKMANSNHLLGRVATQNIIASNGEVVCRAGAIVTNDVIMRATSYSKLRELSFYVK